MFTLDADRLPGTTDEFRELVDRSVRRWVERPGRPVAAAVAGEMPSLASFDLDLTGGTVRTDEKPDGRVIGATEPGLSAEAMHVWGKPVRADGVAASFDLSATGVRLGVGRNAAGRLVVTPTDSADGRLVVSLAKADLEAAVLKGAQAGAAAAGVAVQRVDVTLTPRGPRDVDVRLAIVAKKFVTTTIRVAGRVTVDDELVARATGLTADGDGMVGGLAVGFIRPHLKQVDGKPFPLLAVSMGNVRLRDVSVDVADGLAVTARFGGG